jgi:NMD protein affecting ribosome stability and mRNA decay
METIIMPSLERPEVLICADCGATFPSHGVGDGLEQLCNDCYADQFKPQRLEEWPLVAVRITAQSSPN